jgi:CRP-like cAMP-binding protein
MSESDVRIALGALDLFEGTPPAVLERLAMVALPFDLAADEYLFREGDPGDRIFLLASGGMDALLRLPGGRELGAERLGAGALIGEMAMLAERPRRISVRASEASAGWSFAAADIGRLGATELPEVVRRLGRLALERLREQYGLLAELCGEDPRGSTASRSAELDDAGAVTAVEPEPDETAYLETVLFFSRFSSTEIEDLFGDLRRLEVPRGASVVTVSERGPALLVVIRGAVESSIRHRGLAARTRLAGPGRIVGHLNLLRQGPAPIVSRARERSILLEIPLDRVALIVDRGDDTGRRFGKALYADVVDALFEAQRPISRLAATGG